MSSTGASLLRDARARAGLSRRALASKAGVPTSTISRIEDGRSDPTVTMLQRVLAAAGSRLVIDISPADGGPTLAALATAVSHADARLRIDWTRLRGFADWAAQHPEALSAAIADPPASTHTPLDAILAAFAEQLAVEHGVALPRWTRARGALPHEWSAPATPRMLAAAKAATTEPFRRRNLVLAKSALIRPAN